MRDLIFFNRQPMLCSVERINKPHPEITMAQNIDKRRDVKEVIKELTRLNEKIERLIEKLPTNDDTILANLNSGFDVMTHLLYVQTTVEKGTLFYQQAVGKAMSLKERYSHKLMNGSLRLKN